MSGDARGGDSDARLMKTEQLARATRPHSRVTTSSSGSPRCCCCAAAAAGTWDTWTCALCTDVLFAALSSRPSYTTAVAPRPSGAAADSSEIVMCDALSMIRWRVASLMAPCSALVATSSPIWHTWQPATRPAMSRGCKTAECRRGSECASFLRAPREQQRGRREKTGRPRRHSAPYGTHHEGRTRRLTDSHNSNNPPNSNTNDGTSPPAASARGRP